MSGRSWRRIVALLLALAAAAPVAAPAGAQAGVRDSAPADQGAKKKKKDAGARHATRFFDSEAPLALTLTANLGRLRRDLGKEVPRRAATLAYAGPDGAPVRVPLAVHTRGIWRLKSCDFPPLRLDFGGKGTRGTVFEGLNKPKLVSYCRDDRAHEQYLLQELQLYRVQALVTPVSHRVRLVRMTYADSASGKAQATRYAFVMEDPEAMAARAGGTLSATAGARARDFDPYNAALVGVFQYLIGNTDWSVSALHNAEIVTDSAYAYVLVPYDFDFAGAVNARYATPDPRLPIKSVRERIYMGYCASADDFARAFALFAAKKDAIYALYDDPIGRLLEPRVVKETLAYFDDFYRTIGSPSSAQREIINGCGVYG